MISTLIARLDRGWELCKATTDPVERDRLESHWIRLLHEYERAVDALRGISGGKEAA